ncbi:MAG: transposase [Chloroflexi bacterium]|nr:transposase [Chloroflexota bacterium]BCY17459.1 transposase [Leptolinea sp. HRD-7]
MNYRRLRIPGGTYFFTLVTFKRRQILNNSLYVDTLRESFSTAFKSHPFKIDAHVIMPDHIHMIWTLPEDDDNFPVRWSIIKNTFSRKMNSLLKSDAPPKCGAKGEAGYWQRRYWEHAIRDEIDLNNHIDYIHYNPVKHGYVQNPEDWKLSSFKKYQENGYYPPEWIPSKTIINTTLFE